MDRTKGEKFIRPGWTFLEVMGYRRSPATIGPMTFLGEASRFLVCVAMGSKGDAFPPCFSPTL